MKKTNMDRRDELRGLMQREVEMHLITDEELRQVSGGNEGTSELTCECWCSTGLLSTCTPGTVAP
jgi:bacteriocin-like protein